MLAELTCLSLKAGRVDESEMRARESLALAEQLNDRVGRVFGVGLCAAAAAERGQLERAGRPWGAIETRTRVLHSAGGDVTVRRVKR